jgi:hypothetical protein
MKNANVTSKMANLVFQLVEEFRRTNSFDDENHEFKNVTTGWTALLKRTA